MATVPTPFDATAAQKLTASQWDSQVRDVLLWLMGDGVNGVYPRAHVYDNTNLSIPNNTATLITFNSEVYDTDTMHSTASNQSRVICTTAGMYEFRYLLTLTAVGNTYSTLTLDVKLNSGGSFGGGTLVRSQPLDLTSQGIMFDFNRFMNAGDYIEVFLTQVKVTGGTGSVTLSGASTATRCYAQWIAVS